jgi:hypothetical protein
VYLVEKLSFHLGVGSDGPDGLAEEVDSLRGLAEVGKTVFAVAPHMLANGRGNVRGRRREQKQFVGLI